MNFKRKKITPAKHVKRKGFVVKGITQMHWWDRYDKDIVRGSRQRVKMDARRQVDEAYP